jgi:hypothetical protein
MPRRFQPRKKAQQLRYFAGKANHRSDAARVAGELRQHGSCLACGRRLTDPKSQRLGIGPDCLDKHYGSDPDRFGQWLTDTLGVAQ